MPRDYKGELQAETARLRGRTGPGKSRSDSSSSTGPVSSPHLSVSQRSTLGSSAFCPEERPSCFDQLLTWRACHPNPSIVDVDNGTPPPRLSLSLPPLPPLPPHPYSDPSHMVGTWTRTGWTQANVRRLIDSLHIWD